MVRLRKTVQMARAAFSAGPGLKLAGCAAGAVVRMQESFRRIVVQGPGALKSLVIHGGIVDAHLVR
jgi:hypothetical protein